MSTFEDRTENTGEQEPEGRCDTRLGECAQEIDPRQWKEFLDQFSRDHQEEAVSVEIRGETQGGAHWFTHESPLMGLVASEKDRDDSIQIILGSTQRGPLTHVARAARRLWHQRDDEGREMLQIISEDGTSTILTLIRSRRPQEATR